MQVKAYRVRLRPQNRNASLRDGQPVVTMPGGPPIGKVQDYDPKTSVGTVVLDKPVDYAELEKMGIPWSDFVDFD